MDLMYDKARGTWIEKPEPYAVIEVATKEEYEKLEALVKAMNAKKDTESHSETEIVKGCIALMQELTGQFETYLEFMGINPDTEEERFSVEYSYFHIVQRLLLWTTHHSGGTSTMEKCQELGFDSGDTVIFEDSGEREGGGDD